MQNLIKRKPVWRVAVLHDLCAVGKAAMTNILPVLSVMGLETCPIPPWFSPPIQEVLGNRRRVPLTASLWRLSAIFGDAVWNLTLCSSVIWEA